MLTTVVILLICSVALVIIARLVLKGWRKERYQQQSVQATQPFVFNQLRPANHRATATLYVQEGIMMEVAQPTLPARPSSFNLPASWYPRLRTVVSLAFLLMILFTLFVQSGLADGTLKYLGKDLGLLGYSQFAASDVHTAAHSNQVFNVSQLLVRISQLDPNQYSSTDEYNTWAYSACSTAAMTEVFNAYGRHFRITDVLQVEARIGAITPQLGLLDPSGIQATAAQFGFKTIWSNSWPLDQIITIANQGKPVIIDFPPDRYPQGHLLVLLGGDATTVFLADSSIWNRKSLTRGQFLQWWAGFGAVVTPN